MRLGARGDGGTYNEESRRRGDGGAARRVGGVARSVGSVARRRRRPRERERSGGMEAARASGEG